MDRQLFISNWGILDTITERKILKLVNSFETPEDFRVISDRDGLGYADEFTGRGVSREQAEDILDRRPSGGFQRLFEMQGPGLGADTWSDIIMSAMRLIQFPLTRSLTLTFIQVGSVEDDPTSELSGIDVILYGKLKGTRQDEEWIPLFRETNRGGLTVQFDNIPSDDVECIAIAASRLDDRAVIYRSGPIVLSAYDNEDLSANIFIIHERQTITADIVNEAFAEQIGLEVDEDTFLRELEVSLIDGRMQIEGRITQEDAVLFGDSDIDFDIELLLASSAIISEGHGARFAVRRTDPEAVRLRRLIGTVITNASSSHSNGLLKAFGVFGILIPGLPGLTVPGGVIAIDNSLDNKASINRVISSTVARKVVEGSYDLIAAAIADFREDSPADFSLLVSLGMLELGPLRGGETVADRFSRIMSRTATVDEININPEGIDLSVWLVVPYVIG